MNSKILLLALTIAFLSSCTTAYKSGQTPDDVYYSAAQPQLHDKNQRQDDREYAYSDDYYDDRYLRMKVNNRYRWNDLNDWYSYDRYSSGYNYYYGSYNNPYNSWNYYNNPYCTSFGQNVYNNSKVVATKTVTRPTNFNLAGYTNSSYNNSNSSSDVRSPINNSSNSSVNNNNNSNKGLGNTLRTIFDGNSNNSNNNNSSPSRTYSPSNNNSSNSSTNTNSSSSSSSGGSVTRPVRN